MIRIIFLLSFYMPLLCFSQTWQTLHSVDYHSFDVWNSGGAASKQFKINPYDNSIWTVSDTNIFRIDSNGQFTLFNTANVPLLNNSYVFEDIAFTPTRVVFVDQFYGLFNYNYSNWTMISGGIDGTTLCADNDTIWCARINQPYLVNSPLGTQFGSSNIRKVVSKNGHLWGMNAFSNGFLRKYKSDNSFIYYNADTIEFLLDNQNYFFGFSTISDTFYTSGDKGLSLAINNEFFDTITKFNSTNMPELPIMEFDFDEEENIWAVFGSTDALHLPQKIGFYNRSINTWTTIYDGSNSPIDFSLGGVGIELDTFGNLWVVNGTKLHVLKIGSSTPLWLEVTQLKNEKIDISAYPNPSNGTITFNFSETFHPQYISLYDVSGMLVHSCNYSANITLKLNRGIYFAKLVDNIGQIGTTKILIE